MPMKYSNVDKVWHSNIQHIFICVSFQVYDLQLFKIIEICVSKTLHGLFAQDPYLVSNMIVSFIFKMWILLRMKRDVINN